MINIRKTITIIILGILIACGSDAAQTGTRITSIIPQHGHNSPSDGGVLKVQGVSLFTDIINQLVLAPGQNGKIPFNHEGYDTANMHSNTVNNTRVTIPSGYNYVNINCSIVTVTTGTFDTEISVNVNKNGGSLSLGGSQSFLEYVKFIAASAPYAQSVPKIKIHTGFCSVVAGDYIEISVGNLSEETVWVRGDYTYCSMEIRR